jgi:hypothetical protein
MNPKRRVNSEPLLTPCISPGSAGVEVALTVGDDGEEVAVKMST